MQDVRAFMLDYIQREYTLPADIDIDSFNYVKTGYVDSLGLIKFITLLEETFSIQFTDEELENEKYYVFSEMARLIEDKRQEI